MVTEVAQHVVGFLPGYQTAVLQAAPDLQYLDEEAVFPRHGWKRGEMKPINNQ